MNAAIPEEEIYGLVEMLTFVASLCGDQTELADQALQRFCASAAYPAAELPGELPGRPPTFWPRPSASPTPPWTPPHDRHQNSRIRDGRHRRSDCPVSTAAPQIRA